MTTISKPKVEIDCELLTFLETEEQRTTVVHCKIYTPFPTLARIWDTTYLLEDSGNKVLLIKAFNISVAPNWTWFIPENEFFYFTLLFEGLSRTCATFSLVEDIREPGGFFSDRILRNKSDVYLVELSY